jgi:hypothetical protein
MLFVVYAEPLPDAMPDGKSLIGALPGAILYNISKRKTTMAIVPRLRMESREAGVMRRGGRHV